MLKIAILITSHNRKNLTLKCLSHLFAQKGLDSEYEVQVFLVDDGSTDDTGKDIKKQFPMVNVIIGTGDLYWNRGMHLAWKEAIVTGQNFDYYLWLNDDVVLFDTAVSHLIACAKLVYSSAIICGVFESEKNSNSISYGGGNLKGKVYYPNQLNTAELQECTIINGNCVLIPESVYTAVGLIDPIFPHSLGDHDYALRASKKKIKSYTSQEFIGHCSKNPSLPKWCLPEVSFAKRLKSLYSPLGNSHPYYYTIYINRHFGLLMAIKNLISIHIRVLFPRLWKK
jgi:GT2 family glycosyltransferase